MRHLKYFTCLFFLNIHIVFAQVNSVDARFEEVDAHVAKVNKEFVFHPLALTQKLTENLTNDYDKVRAFYVWIARNIEYDLLAYIHHSNSSNSVNEITRSGKALCSGFSLLFQYFCEQADIEVVTIEGYAKGYGYRKGQSFKKTNHAWNAVKIYGTWHLIDATWATGNPTNLSKHQKKIDLNSYFLTDPGIFIKTHLPEDPTWQLLEQKISLSEFEAKEYDNNMDWKFNRYSPDDYNNLNEFDKDLLIYKRALDFNQQNYPLNTTLSFAYLYKGISITDEIWKMGYFALTDSVEILEEQFYAYMDSAWNIVDNLKHTNTIHDKRIIKDEINYQKGVFNYEISVEIYSKAETIKNDGIQSDGIVKRHFNLAEQHFSKVDATSIYYNDAEKYLTFIQEFRDRSLQESTTD